MEKRELIIDTDGLCYKFPLTATKSSARLKKRRAVDSDGAEFAPTREILSLDTYLEWQISYAINTTKESRGTVVSTANKTSMPGFVFRLSGGHENYGFELTEILYHAHSRGLISDDQIRLAFGEICAIRDEETLDCNPFMQPYRQGGVNKTILGVDFIAYNWIRPMLLRNFGVYNILAEITKDKRQMGSGFQMMLYLCIPISAMCFQMEPMGRTVRQNECAFWKVGNEEARLCLEIFKIFAMLSASHRADVCTIFRALFGNILDD